MKHSPSVAQHHPPVHQHHNGITKNPRCVLWFVFTGNPSKRPSSSRTPHTTCRHHSIRIEQQPLGGATAVVLNADLHIGGISIVIL